MNYPSTNANRLMEAIEAAQMGITRLELQRLILRSETQTSLLLNKMRAAGLIALSGQGNKAVWALPSRVEAIRAKQAQETREADRERKRAHAQRRLDASPEAVRRRREYDRERNLRHKLAKLAGDDFEEPPFVHVVVKAHEVPPLRVNAPRSVWDLARAA
jgi:hypothetical protein